jgi:hypothetical protein
MALAFCIAEDRIAEETGIRLLLLSLREHCPETRVFVFRPDPAPDFIQWLDEFPQVTLIPNQPGSGVIPNSKPRALLALLDRGLEELLWLDTDIALTANPLHLFDDAAPQEIFVVEEMKSSAHQGSAARTKGWALPMGRAFPITMNSCVVRVTPYHRALLEKWEALMFHPEFLAVQKMPFPERPIHFWGRDQNILNALLGSQEFGHVPVRYLKRGRDLIHAGGARTFSVRERVASLGRPLPPFLHSPGSKPWVVLKRSFPLTGGYWFRQKLILELSPYTFYVKRYRKTLKQDTSWLDRGSSLGIFFRMIGFGNYALRGLPICLSATFWAKVQEWKRRLSQRPTATTPSVHLKG